MIRNSTAAWGQVAVTARQNKYFVESSNPKVLQKLVKDEEIQAARAKDAVVETIDRQAAVDIAGMFSLAHAPSLCGRWVGALLNSTRAVVVWSLG